MPFGIGKAIKRHKARKQQRRANRAAMRGDYQAAAFHQNRADNLRYKANVGRRMYRTGMGVRRGPVVVQRAPVVVGRRPMVVARAPPVVVAPRYGAPVYHAPTYHRGGYY